jgi:hypothetical protein
VPHPSSPRTSPRVTPFAFMLVATAAAIGSLSGCGSTCGSNCPPLTFSVVAPPGENLNVDIVQWAGPGCPLEQPNYCAPDPYNSALTCVRFTINGRQPGTCRLDLTFTDGRAPFSATTEFGPETHQGCCHGLPVVGDTGVTIPPLHPKATDAGPDGSDGADASPDAGVADAPVGDPDGSSAPDSGNDQA